ncbi:50S ribosomal protein L6 [Gallaecimonas pentaromativorans]|uniref:Large ribosomal subunit protein uL6 n=1 Tax=Gallaecimonas pentaromativorans TaxID=584787 RepID=A0A3N1NWJ0_9GAMM|nr:50S ribosomal protein L6 [Gallaecimonas pentaromativorans]ROQ18800.1 LSU ribosomal protein L6P [Gallaecimonas pentaromativorans]
MSRVAKAPVTIPAGVEIKFDGQEITVKGKNGTLSRVLNNAVTVNQEDNQLKVSLKDGATEIAQAGTARALINNMVIGVTEGFSRKLQLIGVGYKVQVQGSKLNLALGFSHPVEHELPQGITAECPSQTEVVIKGADKQLVGQVAANVRGYRPPEPYKGKGVRYADETVLRKEAKKK